MSNLFTVAYVLSYSFCLMSATVSFEQASQKLSEADTALPSSSSYRSLESRKLIQNNINIVRDKQAEMMRLFYSGQVSINLKNPYGVFCWGFLMLIPRL